MNQISSISFRLPCSQQQECNQTHSSIDLRITGVILGVITAIVGILALLGMPELSQLGTTGGLAALSIGIALTCVAACIRFIKNQPTPTVPSQKQNISFLETIDPLSNDITSQELASIPSTDVSPSSDSRCLFRIDLIGKDICIYIASFLGPRDQLKSMEVSKDFCTIMRSKILWSEYLSHPEYRIWGATRWNFKKISGSYLFEPEGKINQEDPFQQLRIYHGLCKKNEAGPTNDFFDYLARLMPGGPIAFNAIPQLNPPNATRLQPGDMSAPIIRGRDQQDCCFFAMRLIDCADSKATPVVLIFTRSMPGNSWIQEPNIFWKQDELKLSHRDVLGYILALIGREVLITREDLQSPTLKKTIKLV